MDTVSPKSSITELTADEFEAVNGGGFAVAKPGGQSWSSDVSNLGYINGTIQHFGLRMPMVRWD